MTPTCSPSFRNAPVHPDLGVDLDRVVIHQVAVPDGLVGGVAVGHFLKEGKGVGRRCCREADLDGVEVVQHGPPGGRVAGRVPPVAFVGDDGIEGVNRDVEPGGVFVLVIGIACGLGERALPTEQVDGHALDGGDVDEGVRGLGRGEVAAGQNLRVVGLVVVEVLPAEALAEDVVFLVELEALGRVECRKLPHRLGRQRPAIDQEQHSARWPWIRGSGKSGPPS